MSKSEKAGHRLSDAPENSPLREVSSRPLDYLQLLERANRLAKVRADYAKLLQELESEQSQTRKSDGTDEPPSLKKSVNRSVALQRLARAKRRAKRAAQQLERLQKQLSQDVQTPMGEIAGQRQGAAQQPLAATILLSEKVRAVRAARIKELQALIAATNGTPAVLTSGQRAMLIAAATDGAKLEPGGALAGLVSPERIKQIIKQDKDKHQA